jgi:hypothetical protein
MPIKPLDIPSAWKSQDPKDLADKMRIRQTLELLQRQMLELQRQITEGGSGGGTIEQITSADLSVTVTNPTGPSVDLSVAAGDITAVTAGTGLTGGGTSGAVSLAADFGTGAGKVTQGNDSRLSDARTPTGSAGGDLGGTYPNPTVEALGTSGAAVNVGSAAPPTTGQSLVATSATTATWQTPATPDSWWFWIPAPASAHADSDEFTAGTLNARWKPVKHTALTTTAVPFGTVNTAGTGGTSTTFNLTPNYRGTWLAWQGMDGGIIRQFTMPSVLQVRFRIAIPTHRSVGSFGSLYVGSAPAGVPDITNNFVRHGITNDINNVNGGGIRHQMYLTVGRSAGGGPDYPAVVDRPELMQTQRNGELIMLIIAGGGGTFTYWYFRNGTAVDQIQDATSAGPGVGTNAYLYFRFSNLFNVNGGLNLNGIGLIDYIRIRNDDDLEAY